MQRTLSPIAWLDRARSSTLTLVARTPLLAVVARRDARARARAIAAISFALVVTIACPALALAVSPAVFGVPHIAASVRYLVLRQRLPRWLAWATAALALGMLALRVLEQYAGAPAAFARAEVLLATAWAVLAAAAAAHASKGVGRFVIAAVPILAAGAVAARHPTLARIAFVHVHNLGAPVLWIVAFRRGRFPLGTVLLLVGSLALLVSGATTSLTMGLGGTHALGVDLDVVGRWLVPGAAASVALPLVLAHAFTDSVHYAFWLGVIPDETLAHQGSLSFRMTHRGLVRDFGKIGLFLIASACLVVLFASLVDTSGTRNAYFAIAGFHGYVEGAMLVYVAVRGRREHERAS